MNETGVIKGYKVFNPDWTCNPSNENIKQYTCPGKFEEDVTPSACNRGMHFCKKAVDCFNYYGFDPKNKVAEVIAYGTVVEDGNKCCTNKLKIVREIPWQELLEIVNIGKGCTGLCNSGDYNSGNRNSGNYNSGKCNSGNCNSGYYNSGYYNSGKCNSGNCNSGYYNSGYYNSGDYNSGHYNSGDYNSGYRNSGDYNSGNRNSGDCNSGNHNSGKYNSGDCNSGDWNSGDWNKCSFSNGCFNTVSPKIYLFNKPSEWTYCNWQNSKARYLLHQIPRNILEYIHLDDMTDEEKAAHPEAETTGGYLKEVDNSHKAMEWWKNLSDNDKTIIMSIPNFNKKIFKEITGIDVDT